MIWLGAILAGWLLADFLSGLLHWAEDSLAGDDWPLLGPLVFAPNRLHHEQPMAFTRGGWWERNGTTITAALLVTATILAPILLTVDAAGIPGPIWAMLATATLGGAMASQVHFWAHMPHRAPEPVQMAQAIGLLQSRGHHARHHAPPQDRRYCVLTNWLNPWLDSWNVWRALERLLPSRWLA